MAQALHLLLVEAQELGQLHQPHLRLLLGLDGDALHQHVVLDLAEAHGEPGQPLLALLQQGEGGSEASAGQPRRRLQPAEPLGHRLPAARGHDALAQLLCGSEGLEDLALSRRHHQRAVRLGLLPDQLGLQGAVSQQQEM